MAEPSGTPQEPSRLWRIVLVVSLALNLAVAGLIVGAVVSGRVGEGPPRSFDLGAGPLAQALSVQERRTVGRALRQAGVLRDLNPRARAAQIVEVLHSEPFDPAALRAVLAALGDDLAMVQLRAHEAIVTTVAGMTPERRAALAADIAAHLAQGRGPRHAPSGDR